MGTTNEVKQHMFDQQNQHAVKRYCGVYQKVVHRFSSEKEHSRSPTEFQPCKDAQARRSSKYQMQINSALAERQHPFDNQAHIQC
jgi:hypothetical protein